MKKDFGQKEFKENKNIYLNDNRFSNNMENRNNNLLHNEKLFTLQDLNI